MTFTEKAWKCLIDVVFNNKKEVPIELIAEFRRLAKLHNLDFYCDFLRNKPLPEKLKEDPWEWKCLKELSQILPNDVEALVLKGAAARDMDLYPLPNLRKSCDLDIYFSGFETYDKQKDFVQYLAKKEQIQLPLNDNWQKDLKKLKTLMVKWQDSYIDLHFDIFFRIGNLSSFFPWTKKYNKGLEKEIKKRAISYRKMKNLKKMCIEDFWFYNIFHFIRHFPVVNLAAVLDSYLLVKQSKTSFEKLKVHAKDTNQILIYNIGVYLFNRISNLYSASVRLNAVHKKIFKLERIIYPYNYGIKHNFLSYYCKETFFTNGNIVLSSISAVIQLLVTRLILGSIEENIFSKTGISNLITKILYTYTRLKNQLKRLCFKLARVSISKLDGSIETVKGTKELISLSLGDLRLTLEVPREFLDDLKEVWSRFLTSDHCNKKIIVEKINTDAEPLLNYNLTCTSNEVFIRLQNHSYGKANVSGEGEFFARNFWDVRTFALCLLRAMTFERHDLLLVHAGGIKINDTGVIFPGESSTGKSTFFNLLTKGHANGINDDTILLKKENDIWYMYPTPFMSKKEKPITCEKIKLEGIFDIIKVCGGHEIVSQDIECNLAILLNNSISDFIFDDNGSTYLNIVGKVLEIKSQIKYAAQIMFSLNAPFELNKLINFWLLNPSVNYKYGNDLTKLVEVRGKSMEPTFKHGDILKVREVFPHELKLKDIVGSKNDPDLMPIIHRIKYLIKHKDQTTVITKGDNCTYEDAPVVFKANQKILKITSGYHTI